ncbi:unnamed protein product [Prorocentrum cordatum]|nr:unnamed protein product [Polarella glacialis]
MSTMLRTRGWSWGTRPSACRAIADLSFTVEGQSFQSVLDTGSPFALVGTCVGRRKQIGRCSGYCDRYGCASGSIGTYSGLDDNTIVFSGARVDAAWRRGQVCVGAACLQGITFGVVGDTQSFGGNAGGQNFGLIRTANLGDKDIRPTFLSQTPFNSFVVDLRETGNECLQLMQSLPLKNNSVKLSLVDLREYGAPVVYYAVRVRALVFDGVDVLAGDTVVAVLDTGTTGLLLTEALFDQYDDVRRATAQRGLPFGNVEVTLGDSADSEIRLSLRRKDSPAYGGAKFDVVTSIPEEGGSIYYRAEQANPTIRRPSTIFLGLGFLLGQRISIDTQRMQVQFG